MGLHNVNEWRHTEYMISVLFYLLIILALVYWVEHPKLFFFNSLIIQKHPGEQLEEWLKKFNWSRPWELKEKVQLPQYKFYSQVIETLLHLGRQMGGNYQESLLFLREGLQVDRQFEKKLKELTLGTWLQIGMMMCLTWGFIVSALFLIEEIPTPKLQLSFILVWQLIGVSLLPFTIKKLRVRYFADIGKLWQMLYVLRSLQKIPLSRSDVFMLAGVKDLSLIRQKSLGHLVKRLEDCCQKILKQGGSYEDEVTYMMGELRFQEKWHFELFEKRLGVLKLVILSIFCFPSYLAFIFVLLGDLMGRI